MFEHRSEVNIRADAHQEDQLLDNLLALDADGYELIDNGTAMVHGPFTALEGLQDGLRQLGWEVQEWGHHWAPLTSTAIGDADTARQCLKLLDALDGLDDVRSVSANLELNPEMAID